MGEEKSLTIILTKISSSASLLGRVFGGIGLSPSNRQSSESRGKGLLSLCRVAKEEDECHIRTNILTKILRILHVNRKKNASFCLKKSSRLKKVFCALFSQTLLETLLETLLQTLLVTLNFTFFRKTCNFFSKRLKFVNRKRHFIFTDLQISFSRCAL